MYEDDVHGKSIPYSLRSVFVSAITVSLLLHPRSSLLSTTNADLKKLSDKAKLLQALALDTNDSSLPPMGKMGQILEMEGQVSLLGVQVLRLHASVRGILGEEMVDFYATKKWCLKIHLVKAMDV
ncbi:hypothetical protein SUGI_0753210 [Cryptomeria japonica]|nr:hypothetical protein SUGI_0753210 [Cryptomeria japonica]